MEERNSTIEFRLSAIEKQLEDLKSLMVEAKLYEKDLQVINNRISLLEKEQSKIKEKVEVLEELPFKKEAARWEYIIDYLFKGLVASFALFVFIKLGLK